MSKFCPLCETPLTDNISGCDYADCPNYPYSPPDTMVNDLFDLADHTWEEDYQWESDYDEDQEWR